MKRTSMIADSTAIAVEYLCIGTGDVGPVFEYWFLQIQSIHEKEYTTLFMTSWKLFC